LEHVGGQIQVARIVFWVFRHQNLLRVCHLAGSKRGGGRMARKWSEMLQPNRQQVVMLATFDFNITRFRLAYQTVVASVNQLQG
jgi:hypothetical protein